MAANVLNFQQISTVLNGMVEQITGQKAPAIVDTQSFITVANTALLAGYDQIMGAISQMLAKTIFTERAYDGRFMSLQRSEQEWGNAVRKLNCSDLTAVDDEQWNIAEGQTIDMYKVRLPKILQTNFYGGNTYMDYQSFYREQIRQAFSGPNELSRYLSMLMTNINNRHVQWNEAFREATIANMTGGIITEGKESRVVHLISEYNALTGAQLTTANVYAPENFKPFIDWMHSRISDISRMMATRGEMFSTQLTDHHINRHTPTGYQNFYILAKFLDNLQSMVYSNTYHNDWLKLGNIEAVPYWQNAQSPQTLNVSPSYLKADGSIGVAEAPVNITTLVGVILDRDAAGSTTINQWQSTTPFNSAGGYYNEYWHWTNRYWNDFTENGVVLLLD